MAFVKRNKFKAVTLIMDRRAYNPGLAIVRVGHRGREQNRYCIGKWVVGVPRVFRRHKTDVERDSGSERTGAGHSANARTLPNGRTTCALSCPRYRLFYSPVDFIFLKPYGRRRFMGEIDFESSESRFRESSLATLIAVKRSLCKVL